MKGKIHNDKKGDTTMEDEAIIALYNKRDETAISETSLKYGKYCYKIAYNILSDKEDSEECLDDTWLGAWNSIPPENPNSLKLFLGAIVRNISFDKYRYKHREKRGGVGADIALEEIEDIVVSTLDVEDAVTEGEIVESINRFLSTLDSEERCIFLRRYYFVDDITDIAKRYARRRDNILVILSRTRKKLREHLESEGYTV